MKLFNLKTLSALVASAVAFSGVANAEISLRFGYEAPRSDSQHVAAKKFDELLKDKTKGEIKLKLFPDSTLGNA
ncbi:TRAP dicarboxylate transporter subunit DctP [Actinobacillus lignieresii]|nr:TRAP dicarboxylate transporter subunit DctP [Actinobacillus lignieresii]